MKLKTYLVTVLLISVIFAGALSYTIGQPHIGDVSEVWVQPPFHEASYVVGVYNSTFFYGMNGTTGKYEWLSTNDDTVLQNTIDTTNSSGGGSVYVKAGTYTASVTIKQNVLLVLELGVSGVTYTVDNGGYCIRYTDGYAWFEQPLNMTGHEIKYGAFHTGTSSPANPNVGQWWYDTNTYNLKIYNGTDWATIQGEQGATGPAGTLEGQQPYQYLVFKNATATYMINGATGAIDDYSTDNDVVINWAIANATSGGVVELGLGTFSFSGTITMGTGEVYLRGQGRGVTTLSALSGHSGVGIHITSSGNHIEHMTIDMNDYGTHAIHIDNEQANVIEDVEITAAANDGIRLTASAERNSNKMYNIKVTNAGDYGIYIGNKVGHCWISESVISDTTGAGKDTIAGISVNYGGQNVIYNNAFWGLKIAVEFGTDSSVYRARCDGNTITGCDTGIKLTGSYVETITITHNMFWANNQNNLTGNQYSDIYVSMSSYATQISICGNVGDGRWDATHKAWHFLYVDSNDLHESTVVGNAVDDYWGTDIEDGGHTSVVTANNA